MKLVYTSHAEEKITERKIPKKIIESAFRNPDVILDTRFRRKIVHKLIKDKLLRIIYTKEKDTYIVITAYYAEPERYGVEK